MGNDNEQIQIADNFCSPANKDFYTNDPRPYKRLNNSRDEIRLLLLNVGNRNQNRIEVELKHNVPLAEAAPYYALSYAAGDHATTEVIYVGKRDFNAFKTLAMALQRIRDQLLPSEPG